VEPKSYSGRPVVSVIIPCYNHGHYLPKAIESVRSQTHPAVEIIVVDDGSTDNTKAVATSFSEVRYVYQRNQGLSATRNAGIRHSTGEYLIFLDADDWLYQDAIAINLRYLRQNEQAAFVSGAHDRFIEDKNLLKEEIIKVESDHYLHLLHCNYIGVPAAVTYRKWAFDELLYDVSLKSCEDYDIYLKIARKHPIIHHTEKVAVYRIRPGSMSTNISVMLSTILSVLDRQKENLKTPSEVKAYNKGKAYLKRYYAWVLYGQLKTGRAALTKTYLLILLKYNPTAIFKYFFSKKRIKKWMLSAYRETWG
jgi:glycosyltransferase involved in cell wall biosynthesis